METVKDTPELNEQVPNEEQAPQLTQEQFKQYMQQMQIASAQMGLENSRLSAIQKTLEMKMSKLEWLRDVEEGPEDNEIAIDARKQALDLIKSILAMKI